MLPETFVPLYPSNRWAHDAARFDGWDELWERLWQNAVDVPGPLVDELVAACAAARRVCGDRRQRARVASGPERSTTRSCCSARTASCTGIAS